MNVNKLEFQVLVALQVITTTEILKFLALLKLLSKLQEHLKEVLNKNNMLKLMIPYCL